MRRFVLLVTALLSCSLLVKAKSAPKLVNFSGRWALNTSQTKSLPEGLESYSMVVTQDQQQLKVDTQLKGDLRERPRMNEPYPGGDQQPNNRAGYPVGPPEGRQVGGSVGIERGPGMGLPGRDAGPVGAGPMGEGLPPGIGVPGGGVRPTSVGRRPLGTAADFTLYPQSAIYKLDGGKSSAQLGGPMHNDATSKASWTKGGKELKLSLVGTGNSGWRGGQLDLKDQWTLSKDGQQLIVQRKVSSRGGSSSIRLIFQKQDPAKKT